MAWNTTFARGLLAGGLALAASLVGAESASAQTYYFDFTSANGLSLQATINNLDCSPSCVITTSSEFTGTFTNNGVTTAISFNADDAPNQPSNDNTFYAAGGIDGDGIDVDAGGATLNIFDIAVQSQSTFGSDGSEAFVVLIDKGVTSGEGTLDYGLDTQPSPAPLVGGGAWSWLALAAAGLAARRKSLVAWTQATFEKTVLSAA